MTILHILGILITVALIIGVSVYSSRSVKSASDFDSGGGKAGTMVVTGAIMGTLVGGSSTIGTAQLAYNYGMSAWWFTLGGGIACVILALLYAKPIRHSGQKTLVGIISNEYGPSIRMAASILSSIGTYINILSQLIAATAVIMIMVPSISMALALLIAAGFMIVYVIFGGVLGAGMIGVVKLILLYVAVIVGAGIVLKECNGISELYNTLDHKQYFNLFARGIGTDGGAGLSLILGVLSTQSYAQGLLAGKTDKDAIKGTLLSACLIPPIGIGGILIGLYMKLNCPELASAKMAFPQFVINNLHPLLAGVVLATLLIAVIGTGAGLSLGISAVVRNDIVKKLTTAFDAPEKSLKFSRILIVIILLSACILCMLPIGDTILNFAFMSMGLRGAVVFVPLSCALWLKDKINSKWILASVIVSPIIVLIFGLVKCLSFDPLFLGMLVSLILCFAGLVTHK